MNEQLIEKFESEYRNMVNASIAYAEIQEPYKALDFEDELEWIKNWLRKNA